MRKSTVVRMVYGAFIFWLAAALSIVFSILVPQYPLATCALISIAFLSFLAAVASNLSWPTTSENYLIRIFLIFIVSSIFSFAFIYRHSGLIHSTGGVSHDYVDALYFSVTTWTTVGFGDFTMTPNFRLITSYEALLGLFSVSIGSPITYPNNIPSEPLMSLNLQEVPVPPFPK